MTSGDVLLCDLTPVTGREQGGVRTRHRGLDHHVEIRADNRTELKQVCAMSHARAGRQLGRISDDALSRIIYVDNDHCKPGCAHV